MKSIYNGFNNYDIDKIHIKILVLLEIFINVSIKNPIGFKVLNSIFEN